jgi:hypothetical protein
MCRQRLKGSVKSGPASRMRYLALRNNSSTGSVRLRPTCFIHCPPGVDTYACDLNGSSLEFHHNEDRVADGAKETQDLHCEEVTGMQAVPMRPLGFERSKPAAR